jgi:hypothetical protein
MKPLRSQDEGVRGLGRETQKFKRKAIRVDTRRIPEAAIGYDCHPETEPAKASLMHHWSQASQSKSVC